MSHHGKLVCVIWVLFSQVFEKGNFKLIFLKKKKKILNVISHPRNTKGFKELFNRCRSFELKLVARVVF